LNAVVKQSTVDLSDAEDKIVPKAKKAPIHKREDVSKSAPKKN